jgi:hypothetical protein
MASVSNEADFILAIQAIKQNPKLSFRQAASIYNIPLSSLYYRLNGRTAFRDYTPKLRAITELEEQTIIDYVLDLDSRGFSPAIAYIEDMANNLRKTRDAPRVGTRWAYRFINRREKLKIRWNRPYDYQRALCEDPEIIRGWFRLVAATIAKYGIRDENIYNFDETGFIMGKITASMVVTSAERRERAKKLQQGNREWVSVIQAICANGWAIPPVMVFAGKYHLSNWYQDSTIPREWAIATSSNG